MTFTAPQWYPRAAVITLLACTALLYLWNLSVNGWANGFYAAAAQAGAQNPTAFLFGSSDAANSITVDKAPGALWVMSASVWLFGLNSWSLLVPQALEGVAAVGVLYAAVSRVAGVSAGLLAGAVLALTPVAALMFRYNNPDALLVLLLVVAAYCVQRALAAAGGTWWLPLAGVAVGFAFLAKMMQAFVVLPVFALVYLYAAEAPRRTRVRLLLGAALAMLFCAGWYLLLVELWPKSSRPYIGGSQGNSILELALGYNGLGRLTGDETGGLGNTNFDVGAGRLFGPDMGGQVSWLLPAAVVAIAAGLWITRRAPRTDTVRGALLLWGGWLVVTGVVFSFANGILHSYYTVALAPAIAGGLAIGTSLLWRRRDDIRATGTLGGMVAVTAVWSYLLLERNSSWLPWLRVGVLVAGLAVAGALLAAGRLTAVVLRMVAVTAISVSLTGPAAYTLATIATSHDGAIPSAGPSRNLPPGPPPGLLPGGPGALLFTPKPGPTLTSLLRVDAGRYTWTAAAVGSNNAAGYQLAAGAPVMAVGGYNGTDPSPTLAQFRHYVEQRRIHYFVGGAMMWPGTTTTPSGSDQANRIAAWVATNFPVQTIDGVAVYDLTQSLIAGT
ncbi:glycosyl transferase [Mycolicibacter minnesotensis]|uniref:Glycosyl transferase n=1 Tax=Mycolicibacter minnesotensis TaxID=1118379 RepID=A0A7I7R4R5_9MYCO|nr:glycosyltransferase family 39 protein [Mycolicibacter minnesotensis]ORB01043.1 glycosyl transferase [Mycolicibacter minnesotensis]BBY33432.1 glycosyl transferase [Mycolicibacter minnesotensis]